MEGLEAGLIFKYQMGEYGYLRWPEGGASLQKRDRVRQLRQAGESLLPPVRLVHVEMRTVAGLEFDDVDFRLESRARQQDAIGDPTAERDLEEQLEARGWVAIVGDLRRQSQEFGDRRQFLHRGQPSVDLQVSPLAGQQSGGRDAPSEIAPG